MPKQAHTTGDAPRDLNLDEFREHMSKSNEQRARVRATGETELTP